MKHRCFYFAIISFTICLYSCVGIDRQIVESEIHYVKPLSSQDVIYGEKTEYELWYDKNKWEVVNKEHPLYKTFEDGMKEKQVTNYKVLIHKSQEVFCFVFEERFASSFESISAMTHLKLNIINEEKRKVNGQKILHIKAYDKHISPGDPELIFFSYCLTNKSGTVKVGVATGKNLISEYEAEIFALLNGLVDASLRTPLPTAIEKRTDRGIESKLLKLKSMMDKGLITQEDYDRSKDKLLNQY